MARKYDFTRFITTTVVTVKTVNDDFEVIEDTMFLDGTVKDEKAIQKEAVKQYGKAKVTAVNYVSAMYGLTTEQVAMYGAELNPYTRQPWNDETPYERLQINEQYFTEQLNKKEQG